jgi:CBS domain-containing protein
MLTVRDLLKEKPEGIWAVSPEISTIDALRFLTEKNVGALPVLEGGILVGIISERDFVRRIAQDRECKLNLTVRDTMTSKVITVHPDQTITECMVLMTDRHIRHLPVIEGNDLVGIISIGDVVRGIIQDQTDQIENMEKFILGTGYNR